MNEKFDEEAFLKATNLGEETAVKDAEATERESQRSSDEKQKSDYAKEVASVENKHEETAKDLTRKKNENRVRCEAAKDKLASLEAQLNSSEVLAPAFQYLAPAIKTILETGRADSVKEALNIAISEEKDERERQARREHVVEAGADFDVAIGVAPGLVLPREDGNGVAWLVSRGGMGPFEGGFHHPAHPAALDAIARVDEGLSHHESGFVPRVAFGDGSVSDDRNDWLHDPGEEITVGRAVETLIEGARHQDRPQPHESVGSLNVRVDGQKALLVEIFRRQIQDEILPVGQVMDESDHHIGLGLGYGKATGKIVWMPWKTPLASPSPTSFWGTSRTSG